jgi:hypothetical protein
MGLVQFAGRERFDVAERAALISSALQSSLPAPEFLIGAGLGMFQGELRPIVLVAQELTRVSQPGMYALSEIDDAWGAVVNVLGGQPEPEWLRFTGAFVLPSPVPYVAPGGSISSPNIGTVGCQASWTGGNGFLTAGHVAATARAQVFDGRTLLGTVKWAHDPAGGGTAPQADISVVELPPGIAFTGALGAAAAAGPNTSVTVCAGARAAGIIMALCTFVYWPRIRGTYGDTYLTTTNISSGGDSGSAVVDSHNNVVGLVVGGSANATTFIQDINYQIAQARSLGGLTNFTV